MIAFWIAFALLAIIALAVTVYNIVDGIKKAQKELERMEYENNSKKESASH